MRRKIILVVEDNPGDEALTMRALKNGDIVNEVVVARDGVEALDYLFGEGACAGPRHDRNAPGDSARFEAAQLDALRVLRRLR
jgi:two-component system response regulator